MSNCAWEDHSFHPTTSSGTTQHCSKTGSSHPISLPNPPPGMHNSFISPTLSLPIQSSSSLPSGHSIPSADGYKYTSYIHGECLVDPSPCHSRGSSAISSSNHTSCIENMSPSGTTSPWGSTLQEHDYMGLAEISSSLLPKQEMSTESLGSSVSNMEETDLRLGLGPPEHGICVNTDASAVRLPDVSLSQNGLEYHSKWLVGANAGASVPTKIVSTQRKEAGIPSGHGLDVDARPDSAAKYGLKRGYSEAMSEVPCSAGGPRLANFDKPVDFPLAVMPAAGSSLGIKNGFKPSSVDTNVSSQNSKFQSPPLHCGWAARKPAGLNLRHLGLEQPGGPSGAYSSLQIHSPMMASKEAEMARRASMVLSDQHQKAQDDAPQKGQVIGWPPIGSFRKTTLVAHPKSTSDTEGPENALDSTAATSRCMQGSQASLYVKVNMDGVPVGRKVDLRSYKGYEDLSHAVKDMFQLPNNDQGHRVVLSRPNDSLDQLKPFHFHNDFSLTYEDKEGDWMLVGDVPWSMFVNTVCRLHIMKRSDGTGSVTRAS